MFRFVVMVMFLMVVYGCNHLINERVDPQDILALELAEINWRTVDTYPSFNACTSILIKENQEHCFLSTITQAVQKAIDQGAVFSKNERPDTIAVTIEVSNQGELVLAFAPELLERHPAFVVIQQNSQKDLQNLELSPAYKRGLPIQISYAFQLALK
ncbi:MAG: hypothetical protein ABR84_03440 [Cryomorphaceae bacterium BACL21 MAG-121220-bin10]|jgi:hypothetical protein|nr:MAG: hypothetical protein ABR84_03440 [Cryomorphaceae bacterium BACL21 MAG-121220-bin10]|tara:strand:- start:58295 stop:58765 length:471 start_codon:yes stop_codon:yes gene_type:complete